MLFPIKRKSYSFKNLWNCGFGFGVFIQISPYIGNSYFLQLLVYCMWVEDNKLSFLSPSRPAPPDPSALLALHRACQRHSMPHLPCPWDESCYPRVFWKETETPRRCLGGKSTHLKDTKDLGETTGCGGTILSPPQEVFFCQHTIFCL